MSNDLFNKKKSRFSIRKLNIGVCSVLLCTLVMIGTSAQADENTDTSVSASAPVTALTETTQSLLNTSATPATSSVSEAPVASSSVTPATGTASAPSATPSSAATTAETETPNNESNLVIKTEVGKTTEADVAKEKQKSDEAEKTLELEKKEADIKVELAKKDSEKVNKLEKDAEEGSNVTDKVIDEKAAELKKLESNKENVATEIDKSKSEVETAKKDKEDKEKVAKEKEENSSSIAKDLKSKQSEESSLLAKLKEDKNKLNTLTESLNKIAKEKEESEKALEKAQAALNKAKEEEAENLNKIKQLEAKRDNQKVVLNNKQKQLDNVKAEKEKTEDEIKKNEAINEAIFGIKGILTEIKFDQEFVDALKAYQKASFEEKQKTIDSVVAKEKEAVKKYPILDTDSIDYSKSEKVDVNNLSEKDQILLTQYFNYLNNQVRKQFGLAPAKTNLNVLKFAQDVAKYTKESGFKDPEHDNRSINKAAYENGIDKTDRGNVYNRFESLDAKGIDKEDSQSNMVARKFLFDSIYQSVQRFYHEGRVNNHYDHAKHLMNTEDQTFGTYFVLTPSDSKYYNWLRLGVVSVPPRYGVTDYDDYGQAIYEKFDKLWGAKSEKTLPLLEVKDTTELKANLEKAKSEITRIENEKAAEEKELAKREDELKQAQNKPSKVNTATQAYNSAKKANDNNESVLNSTKAEINKVNAVIDNDNSQAKQVKNDIIKLLSDLAKANSELQDAKSKLDSAKKNEEKLKSELKSLETELTSLNNKILNSTEEKERLEYIKNNHTLILKELEKARKDLEVSSKNAKDALEALKSLEKEAKETYDKYLQIKRQYDMENYTWGVTNNPPVVDLPELSVEDLEKILANDTKTPDTVSNVKRERFAKTSKFKGKALLKPVTPTSVPVKEEAPALLSTGEKSISVPVKEEAPALPSTGEKSTAASAAVGAAMVTSALALFSISTYKRKH
ncbi:SEC10/PgrA surface exclusion domain-containing protein [Streptococcus salivarius]|uniref:SEC10/PgrA surface exclusion domain-containing protein n=1 Tax=Streptococcus salivarius TaxID=1304 RepID=A0AAW6D4N7_STRSL|nr:SEC10/PgrA surface exclusion domain-containing protein [Streptococcus salivarius]MDB8614042.1 SEC10/PgrA surface exclusion domain-containing protein [Streptococcus salivarius]